MTEAIRIDDYLWFMDDNLSLRLIQVERISIYKSEGKIVYDIITPDKEIYFLEDCMCLESPIIMS